MNGAFQQLVEVLLPVVAVATLPVGILTAIFVGLGPAFVVFVVGWLLMVPVLGVLSAELGSESDNEREESTEASTDPLETLRDRYARGEIDDVEFERQVEQLIETEDGLDEVTEERFEPSSSDRREIGGEQRERESLRES